ncbi:MAG: branched-chain amino acid ABC transporter permease [Clostridiales bacterium]|nr:branched-chain amino acid ABC transporter permease [Clostridiales bacterium]
MKKNAENKNTKYSPINTKNLGILIFVLLIYLLIYFVVSQDLLLRQYRSILVLTAVNIILAVSLNLVTGFLGELSLGHAGFMMIGAYAGALFTKYIESSSINLPVPILIILAVIVGGLFAALAGILIGIPVLRLTGDYLAIVTLAFGEIVRSISENLEITNGAAGLSGITSYTNYKNFSYSYIIMIITIVIISNLINSKQGRAILSVRENHIAAESIGINLPRFRLLAFTLGAFFAGIAGVVHAHNQGTLFPSEAGYNKSIDLLVIVVLGGMGNIKGSIIAAIVLTIIPELLRDAADYRQLLYSIVLIILMLTSSNEKIAAFRNRIFGKLSISQKKGE